MQSVRTSFVSAFGEAQAKAIELAAEEHKNGVHDRPGSDPFKWAVAICIGYECISKESFRTYYGITVPWSELKRWIIEDANLASHDGDVDYLGALIGVYNEYMPAKDPASNG